MSKGGIAGSYGSISIFNFISCLLHIFILSCLLFQGSFSIFFLVSWGINLDYWFEIFSSFLVAAFGAHFFLSTALTTFHIFWYVLIVIKFCFLFCIWKFVFYSHYIWKFDIYWRFYLFFLLHISSWLYYSIIWENIVWFISFFLNWELFYDTWFGQSYWTFQCPGGKKKIVLCCLVKYSIYLN